MSKNALSKPKYPEQQVELMVKRKEPITILINTILLNLTLTLTLILTRALFRSLVPALNLPLNLT